MKAWWWTSWVRCKCYKISKWLSKWIKWTSISIRSLMNSKWLKRLISHRVQLKMF